MEHKVPCVERCGLFSRNVILCTNSRGWIVPFVVVELMVTPLAILAVCQCAVASLLVALVVVVVVIHMIMGGTSLLHSAGVVFLQLLLLFLLNCLLAYFTLNELFACHCCPLIPHFCILNGKHLYASVMSSTLPSLLLINVLLKLSRCSRGTGQLLAFGIRRDFLIVLWNLTKYLSLLWAQWSFLPPSTCSYPCVVIVVGAIIAIMPLSAFRI